MLPPKVEQEVLQGLKVVQVADCCIDHKHHLAAHASTHSKLRTNPIYVPIVISATNRAHLGDMLQELGA